MDRRKEVFVKTGPEIAQEDRRTENKKGLIERLHDWVDTVMPDRF